MKIIKSFKNKMQNKILEKMVAGTQVRLIQIADKIKEENGADGSTEKGGWIIVALIIVGVSISFVLKFFPKFFDTIGDKLMEMFNLIKTS